MRGRRFQAKNGGWTLTIVAKWSKGWIGSCDVSGKSHHITEKTLKRWYREI